MASRFYVATKKCFKCDKIVYGPELIAVLDKVWHRACFKCGMYYFSKDRQISMILFLFC